MSLILWLFMVHLVTNVAKYAIIVNKKKKEFLLVQWDKQYDFTWHFPGGRVNEGEKEKEGLMREIKEELGIKVKDPKLVYSKFVGMEMLPKNAKSRYALFYVCALDKISNKIKLNPEELKSYNWFRKSDLPKIKFWLPFYKQMLEEILPF